FSFSDPVPPAIYSLSLHDAVPIYQVLVLGVEAVDGLLVGRVVVGDRHVEATILGEGGESLDMVGGGDLGGGLRSGGGRGRRGLGQVARRGRAVQAELRGAGGPRPPALAREGALRDGDLLLAGRLVGGGRELGAAVGRPGARRELQPALVAVACVDGPVAAGLALRETVPVGVGGGVGGRGHGQSGSGERGAREDDLDGVLGSGGGGGGAVASGVRGHIYASVLFTLCLRGELSGSDECARPPWRLHPKRPVGRRAPSGPGSGPPSPPGGWSGAASSAGRGSVCFRCRLADESVPNSS